MLKEILDSTQLPTEIKEWLLPAFESAVKSGFKCGERYGMITILQIINGVCLESLNATDHGFRKKLFEEIEKSVKNESE